MTKSNKSAKRPTKKTGMLEVRVSPEEKTAFLDACRAAGRSASAVIRDAMRAYTNFGPMARAQGSPIMIASAFAGATAGAFLLVQFIQSAEAGDAERLYGFDTFRAYAVSTLYDREMSWDEYRTRAGSLRDVMEQLAAREMENLPYHLRQTLGSRSGEVIGSIFIPARLDPGVFGDELDRVSAGCWAVLEAYRLEYLLYRFESWDADSSGDVSAREFSDARFRSFSRGFSLEDKDADGFITAADLSPAVVQAWSEAREAAPQPPVAEQRPRLDRDAVAVACAAEREWSAPQPRISNAEYLQEPPQGEAPPLLSAAGHIAARDINGDERVSFAEYLASSGE